MRGKWNTKNNPRDYGIVQNCVGIAELSKRRTCCCRALVHFHLSVFSSIFPLNWTAKQSPQMQPHSQGSLLPALRSSLVRSTLQNSVCLLSVYQFANQVFYRSCMTTFVGERHRSPTKSVVYL